MSPVTGNIDSAPLPKGKHCDYCKSPPVAWFTRTFRYTSRGAPRTGKVTRATCAAHECSVNWQSNLELYKPEVQRA